MTGGVCGASVVRTLRSGPIRGVRKQGVEVQVLSDAFRGGGMVTGASLVVTVMSIVGG